MQVKGWIVVAAVAGLAAGASVVGAFPSGPSVNTGSNPMKTFIFEAVFPEEKTMFLKKQVYEVPQGQVFVVTQVKTVVNVPSAAASAGWTFGGGACIYVSSYLVVDGKAYTDGAGDNMEPGFAFAAGSKIELAVARMANAPFACLTNAVVTGYLMKN